MLVGAGVILLIGAMIFIAAQQTTASQPILQPLEATKIANNANRQATVMSITPPTRPPYPVEPTDTGPTSTPYYPGATVVGDGVIITDPPPIPGTSYRFTTMWRVSLREKTLVFAGVLGGSDAAARQGIIVVVNRNAGDGIRDEAEYRLPDTAGAAMITGVVGQQASIGTINGETYVFDLATRSLTFVASNPGAESPIHLCNGAPVVTAGCPYP
jgi:hypothetical protein